MTEAGRAWALERVKLLLGVNGDERDALLDALIEETGRRVEHYIGGGMPEGLWAAWASMTAEVAKASCAEEFGGGAVRSLSEGGATVAFEVMGGSAAFDRVAAGYASDLNRYRRITWDAPPDGGYGAVVSAGVSEGKGMSG